jgi:hypothetical protein
MRRFLPLFLLLAAPALAQQMVMVKISAGTGFFISSAGDLVTNAHVVKDCKSLSVRTITGERSVTVRASDPERDLAVLHMDGGNVPAVANLRWNIKDLKVGDEVVIMGYPGQEGVAGQYQFKKSTVMQLKGPTGEPNWLQLDSVAEHGNSGGPVLDGAGNVIAVITGNALTYRVVTTPSGQQVSDPQLVGKSDVAITLPVLEDFLRMHNIGYYQTSTSSTASDALLERQANQFIVPVRCYQG